MSQKLEHIRELIEPAIAGLALGVFVWGVEFQAGSSSALLRIYIDALERPVTLDDCEAVSREISAILDVNDPISSNYRLEISSPGLDRPLFEPAHYARFVGEQVRLNLAAPVQSRRKLSGRIVQADNDRVVVANDLGDIEIPFGNILGARLQPVFATPSKPSPRNKPGRGKRR